MGAICSLKHWQFEKHHDSLAHISHTLDVWRLLQRQRQYHPSVVDNTLYDCMAIFFGLTH